MCKYKTDAVTRPEAQLEAALAWPGGLAAVRSLRRDPEAPDETCWLAGDGWWLSTALADPSDAVDAGITATGLAGRPPS